MTGDEEVVLMEFSSYLCLNIRAGSQRAVFRMDEYCFMLLYGILGTVFVNNC